ncbi:MAG TPA: phenylalanine--tRNA ligase subunit alpha [bacterium]|nr:phenylalanine--tRNA ligase subunit alpha [bacterium]
MINKLDQIKTEAVSEIKSARSLDQLEQIRVKYLGRKSQLTEILRGLSQLDPIQRPAVGQYSNQVKCFIENTLNERVTYLNQKEEDQLLFKDIFDVSLPSLHPLGHLHPLTRVKFELEDYFERMGYMIYETNNLTNEYDNFIAVNIPADHPARSMWDTFWVKGNKKNQPRLCMPPHTSAIQNHILRENKPPYKAVALGRCFRFEATDATHEHTFYQIEGVVVDRKLNVGHLKKALIDMVQFIIGKKIAIRLRPSYFPFVEPGFEVDAQCQKCQGRGCNLCKGTGWIEMLGAGMIHQNVFVEAGYKRNEWTGFAYGPGYDRLAMMRYGINDIRHFFASRREFIEQF